MLYFRVKKEYDGHRVIKLNKRGRQYIDGELIGEELLTPAEFKKLLNNVTCKNSYNNVFESVVINKTQTYWMFGARFELPATYEDNALITAESRGIIEYKVNGKRMVYFANYPAERNTYKVVIDLDTMIETRTALSKYYKKGNVNMYK